MSSILKMMFGKHAPTHYAEKYAPTHDKSLNLTEARRGRGKSYGSVKIALAFLKEVLPGILAGTRPYTKIYANNKFNIRRMALYICQQGWVKSHAQALQILRERIVYITSWDQLLTAYDSLVLMDEANRNINVYDSGKGAQVLMLTVHDWLQQTRKHLLTLWFFVQNLDWVKPQLRMLMDRLWRARRVMNKSRTMVKAFPWYGSDPFGNGVGSEIVRKADFKMRWPFEIEVARMYDSWQAIATLPQETTFNTFEEISDHMYVTGKKPLPSPTIADALTHQEMMDWFSAPPAPPVSPTLIAALRARNGQVTESPETPPALPAKAGGAGGAGCEEIGPIHGPVRPPLPHVDLSELPTTFPAHLL